MNAYKNSVIALEREFEIFKLELQYTSTNPIIWFLKLIFGCIFCVVSLMWWLHM